MPLVGREEELHLLLARWRRAGQDGEGQVVLLSGEPGSASRGSSRRCASGSPDSPTRLLSHYCSPYHTASALYPIIGLLERAAGFARDDPPEAKLDKLEALLAAGHRGLGRGGAADRRRARHRGRRALPVPQPEPAAQGAADARGPGRAGRGPRVAAAGARPVRGRALDRSDHAGSAGSVDRARRSACRSWC